MTEIQIEAGDILASAEERTVTGLLLPFGEVGNTNVGKFMVEAGSVEIPSDPSVIGLNTDHARDQTVGRATALRVQPRGVFATFKFADTPEGDAALADALALNGKRRKLSAEFGPAVIRGGKLVSARLFGAALVEKGAYPSAAVLAADVGDDPETPTAPVVETPPASEPAAITSPKEEAPVAPAAVVPDAIVPPKPTAPAVLASAGPSIRQVMAAYHAIATGQDDGSAAALLATAGGVSSGQVFAALNDIKYRTGVGAAINQVPQWLGELYGGRAFARRFAPLFNHADLTAKTVAGWKWTTKPAGGDWAGDKAVVPTNTPVAAPYTEDADSWAMGHDHAREYRDFPSPEYWESYYRAGTESYEKWVDLKVLTEVTAAATDVVADNPAGLTIGAGMSALIDGLVEVIDNDATPTFAVLALALYKGALKTPQENILGYLNASLGLEAGTLNPGNFQILGSSAVTAGHVIVGAKEAVTVHELPGVPIRVEALDMVKGGIDTGMFGYELTAIHKADAIIDVAPYVAP